MMGRRIIDDETGEIIQDGSTISTPAQTKQRREYYETKRMIEELQTKEKEGRKEKFIFNVLENVKYVTTVLTSAQCGYLLFLSTFINYDGLLVTSERSPKPMRKSDMMAALGMRETQKSTFSNFINSCLDHGIILEDKGEFYVSDGVHKRGKNYEPNVSRAYISKLRKMASVNKPEHVGLLYALTPYINKHDNRLCENPDEIMPSKCGYLSRSRIAEIGGVKPAHITRVTGTMIYEGKSVFAKVSTATDGTFYMLNYNIFRRADVNNYDGRIIQVFGEN